MRIMGFPAQPGLAPGFMPGIRALNERKFKGMDGRDKAGHERCQTHFGLRRDLRP